jgi:natural product precursor
MKKLKFESLNKGLFQAMDVEKMKRVRGGYTLNTVTCTPRGNDLENHTDGITGD